MSDQPAPVDAPAGDPPSSPNDPQAADPAGGDNPTITLADPDESQVDDAIGVANLTAAAQAAEQAASRAESALARVEQAVNAIGERIPPPEDPGGEPNAPPRSGDSPPGNTQPQGWLARVWWAGR